MCTAITSSLLPIITILCSTRLVIEGLPLLRRERDFQDDIIAGEDFVALLMESNRRFEHRQGTTPSFPQAPSTYAVDDSTPLVRETRSTAYLAMTLPKLQTDGPEEFGRKVFGPTTEHDAMVTVQTQRDINYFKSPSEFSLNDAPSVVLDTGAPVEPAEEATTEEVVGTTEVPQQILVVSEERPSLISKASKSEFSVDESDPITSSRDVPAEDFASGYSANVRTLPNAHSIPSLSDEVKRPVRPLHQTVIYHSEPNETGRARSVSYSTVIQSLPQQGTMQDWEKQDYHHDRQERHYEGTQQSQANNYNAFDTKNFGNRNQTNHSPQSPMAETNDYYVTTKYNPIDFNENTEKPENAWKKTDGVYQSTSQNPEPVERNWGIPEKHYAPPLSRTTPRIPIVYGQPEQNYEVDESVSVMSNGRTHGVQRTQTPTVLEEAKQQKKVDENQKVGYVVEGRNYRKYRVEERTPDGFIVGEYGVVSHDDGSLRGVRYTADGTINPRLIYDALMKFLAL